MTTSTSKSICSVCNNTNLICMCTACSNHFCFDHFSQHRTNIEQQYDQFQNDHDEIRQQINDLKLDPTKHPFITHIDRWEQDSINKIKQQAQLCRRIWIHFSSSFFQQLEGELNQIAEQFQDILRRKELNEVSLDDLKRRLELLHEEFIRPTKISIKYQSTSFIDKISLLSPIGKDSRWKQFATTIVGSNGQGNRLDQLNFPRGIFVDDQNQLIYIADLDNHRIVEWNLNTNNGRIVAGGNGQGNRMDQLNQPSDVIIDRHNNDLIIADYGNRRVMRCSRHSESTLQVIIDDIDCARLVLDRDGSLYVSDWKTNEVRRWKKGERFGKIVAGGHGQGNRLNQFYGPTFLSIDDNYTLYVSDFNNHRVMKWMKNAKEGIVVAGGNGRGDRLTQLSCPLGVLVDPSGQIYVADSCNDRVIRWCEGEKEGRIVVGGNVQEQEKSQLNGVVGFSFDGEGNLYVADCRNHRIVKFERDYENHLLSC